MVCGHEYPLVACTHAYLRGFGVREVLSQDIQHVRGERERNGFALDEAVCACVYVMCVCVRACVCVCVWQLEVVDVVAPMEEGGDVK